MAAALQWLPGEIILMGGVASLWLASYKRPELAPLTSAASGAIVAGLLSQRPIMTVYKKDGSECGAIFDLDLAGECGPAEARQRGRNIAIAAVVGVGLGLAYRSYRRR